MFFSFIPYITQYNPYITQYSPFCFWGRCWVPLLTETTIWACLHDIPRRFWAPFLVRPQRAFFFEYLRSFYVEKSACVQHGRPVGVPTGNYAPTLILPFPPYQNSAPHMLHALCGQNPKPQHGAACVQHVHCRAVWGLGFSALGLRV